MVNNLSFLHHRGVGQMNTFEVGIICGVCLTNKMKTQISMGMNQLIFQDYS